MQEAVACWKTCCCVHTADDWIIYLDFLLQNGSGYWILDGDEGRVGHGPPRPPLDPPLSTETLGNICNTRSTLKHFQGASAPPLPMLAGRPCTNWAQRVVTEGNFVVDVRNAGTTNLSPILGARSPA